MKHRKTYGFTEDARKSAEHTMADPRATDRIVESVDWELVDYLQKRQLEAALSLLSPEQRRFAKRVLNGVTWEKSGVSKSKFYWRIEKIEIKIRARKH